MRHSLKVMEMVRRINETHEIKHQSAQNRKEKDKCAFFFPSTGDRKPKVKNFIPPWMLAISKLDAMMTHCPTFPPSLDVMELLKERNKEQQETGCLRAQ